MAASRKAFERIECTHQEKPNRRKRGLSDIQSYIQRNSMPIIQCECGEKILLIPDLRAMNIAIENHLAAHKRTTKKTKINEVHQTNLRQFLVEQLFQLSTQTSQDSAWLKM